MLSSHTWSRSVRPHANLHIFISGKSSLFTLATAHVSIPYSRAGELSFLLYSYRHAIIFNNNTYHARLASIAFVNRYAPNGLKLVRISEENSAGTIAPDEVGSTVLVFSPEVRGQPQLRVKCVIGHPFFAKDKGEGKSNIMCVPVQVWVSIMWCACEGVCVICMCDRVRVCV